MQKPDVLQILVRRGGVLRINTKILPPACNKPDIINRLYGYVTEKYAHTHGKFQVSDINKDLTDLLKREGLI
jgi:hypothetical protein